MLVDIKIATDHTIIAIYGPNKDARQAAKNQFFEELQEAIDEACNTVIIELVMALKNNGTRLLEFCLANNMTITSTQIEHKDIQFTRSVPSRNKKSTSDYTIVQNKDGKGIKDLLKREKQVQKEVNKKAIRQYETIKTYKLKKKKKLEEVLL